MLKSVKDMYAYTSRNSVKLLSDFNADFWQEYLDNYTHYDKLFCRLYRSFNYFLQDGTETISELTTEFIADVYNHLLLNRKKYEELFRVYTIPDSEYSITNNYNIKEIMDRDTSYNNNDNLGRREDSLDTGAQTNTSTSKVAPYDSNEFSNSGQVTDSLGARHDVDVKGQQLDNHTGLGTEDYTLTRVGNIGTKTVTEVMREHTVFWDMYEFYSYIFREICRELLLITD